MFKRSSVIALGIVAGLSVVACGGGGGGGGSAVSPPTTVKPSPAASASNGGSPAQSVAVAPASFTILIPSATSSTSSTHRTKKSIAANTQSVVFTLMQTTAAGATLNQPSAPYALTPTSSGCTTVSGGLQCVIGVNAVIGTDVYVVDTYSSTNAAPGTKVGSGAFSIVVQANQSNTASLVLSGKVNSVILTSAAPVYADYQAIELPGSTVGIAQSASVYAIALDSSGNTILSPDTYSTPITLSMVSYQSDDAIARRGGAGFRRTAQEVPFYGSLTVTYASIDGASTASATASNTNGVTSVQVYSPEDTLSVTTTALDSYTEQNTNFIYEFIGVFASVSGTTTSTPAPYTYGVPSNQIAIGIVPLPAASPTPAPSPSPSGSPAPSPSPTGVIAFTGINVATPAPSPSPSGPTPGPETAPTAPNPTLQGLGPAQSTYYNGNYIDAAASLDLNGFPYGQPVYVFLTDTNTAAFQSAGLTCSNSTYVASVTTPVNLGGNLFRFSLVDQVDAPTVSGCNITLTDASGTQAVLEVFQNMNSITVDAKGRKHE